MARPRKDWASIEADYLATGMAYNLLAKKWGVSLSTVKKRAAEGRWSDKFADICRRMGTQKEPDPPAELVVDMALERRSARAKRMIETTDAMMDRIIDALQIVKPEDTYALMTLIRSLKELREIQGLNKTELDIEEQRARIAKLKSETRHVDGEGGSGGIIFLPAVDDMLTPPGDDDG